MRPRLFPLLALVALLVGGVAHEAFAGRDGKSQPTLTASQKAARAKLLATAAFLKKHHLNCGCQHHFPAAKS